MTFLKLSSLVSVPFSSKIILKMKFLINGTLSLLPFGYNVLKMISKLFNNISEIVNVEAI